MKRGKFFRVLAALLLCVSSLWLLINKLTGNPAERLIRAGKRKDAKINARIRELGDGFGNVRSHTDWKVDLTLLIGEVRSQDNLDRLLSEMEDLLTPGELKEARSNVKVIDPLVQ